ncbi:MAG: decarboxylating 6-phosphogluconate dehydrogenase [Chloroflexi bacterium]|nr:decarboxylating 6-phosphogluconate dehydrogenase [Chloroflexota bacterium]
MKLALVGLGKMGANMARRLVNGGHDVVGYNRSRGVTDELAAELHSFSPAYTLEEVVDQLAPPRIIWTMVPSGEATENTLLKLGGVASPGDILVDGGNSNYKDTIRRAGMLEERRIHFVDAGVSGGIWGLKEGYSLMIGGDKEIIDYLTPIFASLAPAADRGWGRVGPHGSGHYVKMVHNGIEYGMMEALAEGFELMRARQDFTLDLANIAEIWRYGSVVRSWLLDLTAAALAENPELRGIQGWVADSGEGRWTAMDAIEQGVPAPVITLSLFKRFESRQEESYSAKLLAAMRNQFGGHEIRKED